VSSTISCTGTYLDNRVLKP